MAGVDNDMRSVFFVPEGSTIWHRLAALEPFTLREARARDDMKRLAVELPVWKHGVIRDDGQPVKVSEIRRFAALGLAIIIAEAGDLASYSNPARLWKRLGVGLHAGQAQGRLPTNATSEQRRELWKQHRYNPARRSRIWTLGEALVKFNDEGKYKRIYDTPQGV